VFVLELSFKGGCREVGRSGLLVNGEILLDYGIKAGDIPEYPRDGMEPKAVLVSHGHLDHCGAVPNLMYLSPEVFMTPPTAEFTSLLGRDTLKLAETTLSGVSPFDPDDLQKLNQLTRRKDYGETFKNSWLQCLLLQRRPYPRSFGNSHRIRIRRKPVLYRGSQFAGDKTCPGCGRVS